MGSSPQLPRSNSPCPLFASPCPPSYATTLLSPRLPSFPSLSSFHSLFSSPLPTTLTHLSHNPLPVPACPHAPPRVASLPPHSTVPADLREPAAAPPASNPLLPSLAVKLFCTCWQCGGSFGAAGRRGRPAATAPPCRASHATLAGNVVSLVREACECCSSACECCSSACECCSSACGSAALAHVSAAPAHVSAAPTHVSAAPAHVGAAPAHVGAAPAHVSAAPAHVSAAPAHVSAAPAHASAAPAHVGAFRVLSARLPGACQQRVQVLAMPRGCVRVGGSTEILPRLPSLSLS
ncbi:unnamed protein product [Closterium sp. NIES-64]|nr:unnamed protein product [Closterium sp. NIES-64]